MIKILHRFFYAWIFLTRLPAPPLPKASKEDWGRVAPYFTLIGSVIGLVLYFVSEFLIQMKIPFLMSSLLILLFWVLITGGLHLDGLMDTFDAIGCTDENKKMEAMRDSRIGAFGAMGGILVILFKLVSLCTLLLDKLFFVILISAPLARLVTVYSFTFLSQNKNSGISSSLILSGVKKPNDFIVNGVFFICLMIPFLPSPIFHLPIPQSPDLHFFFLPFLLICFLLSVAWAYWLNNYFKGHTGDTFGALIELSETSVLVLGVILKKFLIG